MYTMCMHPVKAAAFLLPWGKAVNQASVRRLALDISCETPGFLSWNCRRTRSNRNSSQGRSSGGADHPLRKLRRIQASRNCLRSTELITSRMTERRLQCCTYWNASWI